MADSKQFGSPKILQFGDKTTGNQPGDSEHCAQCEAMLADALDGTLSATDQEFFDLHMAHCVPCAQGLADARRGAAFLELLRTPAPEPPADLLERILAQTTGVPAAIQHAGSTLVPGQQPIPAMAAGYDAARTAATYGNVIPFPRRFVTAVRTSSFGQLMLQPRLAMTAAMAFFSIALTMNLTGFNPLKLRASDLAPSSLRRDFFAADTHVVQYYENLRVVYELESRVHDLQSAQDADAAATSAPAPANGGQPASPGPSTQPGSNEKSAPQPDKDRQEHSKPAPSPGSSRREDPTQSRRYVAYTGDETDLSKSINARPGRKLV